MQFSIDCQPPPPPARKCTHRIEASHFQIMSANLTTHHPNISSHVYIRRNLLKCSLNPVWWLPVLKWRAQNQRLLYKENWLNSHQDGVQNWFHICKQGTNRVLKEGSWNPDIPRMFNRCPWSFPIIQGVGAIPHHSDFVKDEPLNGPSLKYLQSTILSCSIKNVLY